MRVAQICDTCATYINASCIIYNGDYLTATESTPLDSLDIIIEKINNTFPAISSANLSPVPKFLGQFLINSSNNALYVGLSTTVPNWGLLGAISTTTTTTTAPPTTTTTTTV